MTVTITFDTDNAAFGEPGSWAWETEVERIVSVATGVVIQNGPVVDNKRYPSTAHSQVLLDANGNTVGRVVMVEVPDYE